MMQTKLWKWEDNAEVLLMWSKEDDMIQAVVTSNDRVIFHARISDITGYRTFQTFVNEMGLELKVGAKKYKFICSKESDKVIGFSPFYPLIYTSIIMTFSASAREEQTGLKELRGILISHGVKVGRSAYLRTFHLAMLIGLFVVFMIAGVANILNII